jgi:hypothetical protein
LEPALFFVWHRIGVNSPAQKLDMLEAWGDQHAVTGGRLIVEWDALSNRYHRRRSAGNRDEAPQEQRPEALGV